jgi:hypothetical protein
LRVQVVLGPWPTGPRLWWLATQRLIQGCVAGDAEDFLDLPAGAAGPAQGDGALVELLERLPADGVSAGQNRRAAG